MKKNEKSSEMLVQELNELRQHISKLETQHRETEKALADSKEIYQSITNDVLDCSRVGIIILDSNFRIAWINKSLVRYLGLKIEDILGKYKKQLIRDHLKDIFEQPDFYASKVLATYEDNNYIEQFECHILPKEEREERWLEHWSRPIRSGLYKGGRIEHYTDITERKQAELFLQVAKNHSERLINSSKDIIISVDLNRKIIEFNRAAQRAFGYGREEVLGKHIDILYADPREGLLMYDKTLEEGYFSKEITNKKKNGETFNVYLSASVVYDENDRPSGLMGISKDFTDTQHYEKELLRAQKLESVGLLAGGIAHNFNNQLTSIIGSISLIKKFLDSQNHKASIDALEIAKAASQRAHNLTQKLLTFSKGGTPVRKTWPAGQLIKDIVGFVVGESNVNDVLGMIDDLPAIKVDSEQIRVVMQSLITNADEAILNGGTVRIEAESTIITKDQGLPLTPGNYVKIIVKDTGAGIPRDQIQKIFDPFYTTKKKNSGLGLATAFSIIRKHEGFVTVDSKVGFGSTFYVYLPACEESIIKQTQPQKKSNEIQANGKVLVLDDEDCIKNIASKMLERVGYVVETASTGEEALDLFRHAKEKGDPFDVVILDLAIAGGMGGKEVIKILRKEDSNIKALVSSGYYSDPIMSSYTNYGFDDVVTKPYTLAALCDKVNNLMESKS